MTQQSSADLDATLTAAGLDPVAVRGLVTMALDEDLDPGRGPRDLDPVGAVELDLERAAAERLLERGAQHAGVDAPG